MMMNVLKYLKNLNSNEIIIIIPFKEWLRVDNGDYDPSGITTSILSNLTVRLISKLL